MYYFKFLHRSKTYVPTYSIDFMKFGTHGFLFGACLEAFLLLKGRYEKIYKSAFLKELNKVKAYDQKITDKKRKTLLISQKTKEIEYLEQKLKEINKQKK